MTIQGFNRLNQEEKCKFIFDKAHCTPVMSYWESPAYFLSLYHVSDAPDRGFFIERGLPAVRYNEDCHCIELFVPFMSHWALEAYLPHIDISGVCP